ncbi:MAG: DUF1211 domain-containing protein [Solirubrobacterales bacterium]|nr:DUF1211 domain-containing protein [Solirubrobacterales bacterium]
MEKRRKLDDLERGRDLSRILAFTDGVFAIAATLLVLQIDVPSGVDSASALWDGITEQGGDLWAYLFSFLVIGFFWIHHHRFMREVAEFDRGLMLINLVYLVFVVLIPFTSQVIGEYGEYPVAVTLYAINMSLVSLAFAWIQRHSLVRGLVADGYEWDAELSYKSSLFSSAYFLVAIPLSLLVGSWALLSWFGMRFDPFQKERDRVYENARRQAAPTPGSGDRG